MTAVLAIDLGTTGVKVALVSSDGTLVSAASETLPLLATPDGGVEQDPHGWWAAIGRCARRAVADAGIAPGEVDLVAVTSQYNSTVAVDNAGMPLANAIMWMDGRGRHHHPGVARGAERADWVLRHGMAPNGGDTIGHVATLRAVHADAYTAACAFVEPMDAIVARLTGHVTSTQHTAFSRLTVDNRRWGDDTHDPELVARAHLDPTKLAPLVPMGEPRGHVTAAAADHLGITATAIVSDATIDSVTSAVGTGAVDTTGCGLVIGTTAVIATHLPERRMDVANGLTAAPSPIPNQYFLVAENGVGGKALEAFVHGVVYPADGLSAAAPADAFAQVLALAATVPPGSNGVTYLPWLVGSMAPRYHGRVRGGFVGLGLDTTRADMGRALLEGVAANAAWLLPFVATLAGSTFPEIGFGGGAARSPLWAQIVADTMQVRVRRMAHPSETNAHGAALLALVHAGRIDLADVAAITAGVSHDPNPALAEWATAQVARLADAHTHLAALADAHPH